MPYTRPTLTQERDQALQDIQNGNLPGVDGLLTRSVLRVLAYAQAGLSYLHYGYQDWIARQAVPWTATDEHLEGWAALKAVTRKPATDAVLQMTFTGVPGTVLPLGTAITALNALAFTTTAATSVSSSGSVSVPASAAAAGSAYNLAVGTQVALAGSVSGINSAGAVSAIVTPGADRERDDPFRTRVLQVYANPPQGGAQSDYVTWAEAVPGVTRAWCSPNGFGPGTVIVYAMLDDAEGALGGFPQGTNGVAAGAPRHPAAHRAQLWQANAPPPPPAATGDQLSIANAIYPLQPVTALVYACAPQPFSVAFTIVDVFPFTAAIEAGIAAALTDMFLRLGSPLGMTLYPSDWNEAISSVSGLEHFAVASPAAPVLVPLGFLPLYSGTSTASP